MAISETQLQTWTDSPSSTKLQYTHEQVRKALLQSEALKNKDYKIYLQGSYANSTNIRVDSDIDIVVQLNSTFMPNLSGLSELERNVFHSVFPNATYHWPDFKRDVVSALRSYFGFNAIKIGNKSIKLVGDTQRLNADVIPCLQYRKYNSFDRSKLDDFIEGMKFWTGRENIEIINYPLVHIENGEDKNAEHRTDQKYKDLVRITKNIRRQLVEQQNFNHKTAPSYFVECTIYNTPDETFQNGYQSTLESIFDFMKKCPPGELYTVSHQHLLFGLKPWQWNVQDAAAFFKEAENFYQNN
jgi:predicted nucleotidyltransferase